MPKAKKSMKLRDQKPAKDPRGGGKHGPPSHHLNTGGTTEGNKDQRHGHGRHHSNF